MRRFFITLLSLIFIIVSLGTTAFANGQNETTDNKDALQIALKNIKAQYLEEFKSMSSVEKEARLIQISNRYTKPGQILSEQDSAFILLIRVEDEKKPQTRSGASSQWYNVYKTEYGVTVNLYGNMRQDICYIAGSSRFGGSATAWIQAGTVSRVDLAIHHTAYGLIGTSAPYVGVLYNGSVSMTQYGNNTFVQMDKEAEYGSVLPLYTTMYASGTIKVSSGSEFTILSSTWTSWQ